MPATPIKFLHHFLKKHYGKLLIYALCACAWAFLSTFARPKLIELITNRVAVTQKKFLIDQLKIPFLMYVGMLLSRNLIQRIMDFIFLRILPAMRANITKTVTDYALGHSFEYFQRIPSSTVSNRVHDLNNSSGKIVELIWGRFFGNILAFIFACLTLASVHWFLTVVLCLWSLFFGGFTMWSARISSEYAFLVSTALSKTQYFIVDIISNIVNIKAFACKEKEVDNLGANIEQNIKLERRAKLFALKISLIQGFLVAAMVAVTLAFMIYQSSQGQIAVGSFGLIFVLYGTIIETILNMSLDVQNLTEYLGIMKRGFIIISSPHELVDVEGAKPISITEGKIQFKHVFFRYENSPWLFEDLNVEINPGEKIGLVGFSGGGKTSFIHLILRFYNLQEGDIYIDGQNIALFEQNSLRSQISFIPQDPTLLNRTIWENLRFANDKVSDEAILEVIYQTGLNDFVQRLPDGLQTVVGERGVRLSGGQRQRIAIARSVLKSAKIVILDEATSALDNITERYIQNYFNAFLKDKTTIIIAHRLSTLRKVDRILVFDKGKIVQDGSFENLCETPGLFRKLWLAQTDDIFDEELT